MTSTNDNMGAQPLILVVDDNQMLRALHSRVLTNLGYQVVEVDDGQQALAVLEQQPIDCILLDVMMPGIDGFEVCRRAKGNPATAHIPVVLVTSLIDEHSRQQGLEAGADEMLGKSVDMGKLRQVIQQLMPHSHR